MMQPQVGGFVGGSVETSPSTDIARLQAAGLLGASQTHTTVAVKSVEPDIFADLGPKFKNQDQNQTTSAVATATTTMMSPSNVASGNPFA